MGLLLLVLGGAWAANWFINRYVTVQGLQQRLSGALHRDVRLETYSFSLWSGLQLNGLEISEHPNWESGTMVKTSSVKLQPSWLALLTGRIVIRRARVENPRIHLFRKADGSWNLQEGFLGETRSTPPRSESKSKTSAGESNPPLPPASSPAPTLQFTIDEIVLVQGKVDFEDRQENQTLNFSFERIVLSDFHPARGGELLLEQTFLNESELSGRIELNLNPLRVEVNQFNLREFSVKPLLPYLESYLPGSLSLRQATLDASLEQVRFDPDSIEGRGLVRVRDFEGDYPPWEPIPAEDLAAEGRIDHDRSSGTTRFVLNRFFLDEAELTGTADLTLDPPWNNPTLSGTLRAKDFSTAPWVSKVRKITPGTLPESLRVAGTVVSTDISLSGSLQSPLITGTLEARKLRVQHAQLPLPVTLNQARLNLEANRLGIEAEAEEFGGSLTISGTVDEYRTPDRAKLDLIVEGNSLSLPPLLELARNDPRVKLPDLNIQGSLADVKLQLTGPATSPRFTVNGSLSKTRLAGPLLGGAWTLSEADFNLDPERVRVNARVAELGDALRVQGEFRDYFQGTRGTLDLTLEGSNLRLASLAQRVRSLNLADLPAAEVSGTLRQVEGTVSGSPRQPKFQGSGHLADVKLSTNLLPRTLNVPRLEFEGSHEKIDFQGEVRELKGTITIRGSLSKLMKAEQRELALTGSSSELRLEPLAVLAREQTWMDLPPFESSGELSDLSFEVSGPLHQLSYRGRTTLSEGQLQSERFPGALRQLRGTIQFVGGQVRFGPLEGSYENRPFQLRGNLPVPPTAGGSWDLTADVDRLPLQAVLEFLPPGSLPEGLEIRGPISLASVRVQGTVDRPRANGLIRAEGLTIRVPQYSGTISGLQAKVQMEGESARIEQYTARVDQTPVRGKGTVNLPSRSLNLTYQTESFPVASTLQDVKAAPELPSNWQAGGSLSTDGRVTGTLTNPRIQGEARAPTLSAGPLQAQQAQFSYRYQDQNLQLSKLTGEMLGGTLQGDLKYRARSASPQIESTLRFSKIGLGNLLGTFLGRGRTSRGSLGGRIQIDGPPTDPSTWNGLVTLEGVDWVLRETGFDRSLTRAFDFSLENQADGLDGLVDLFVRKSRITESLGLDKIFNESVTSRFQQASARLQFKNGQGNIETLQLVNDKLSVGGNGTINLGGNLNVNLQLKPKKKLLDEVGEDWIRRTLQTGLPPLAITGTYRNPRVDYGAFSKALTTRLIKQRTLGRKDDRGDTTTADQNDDGDPARKILEDLFD